MDPFIGEIRLLPYTFAPRGWMACEGQLLPIASNTALFSILGTTYGGDGRSTFALPDLRGRAMVSAGHGPGLQAWREGERQGTDSVTLLESEIPAHNHEVTGFNMDGASGDPKSTSVLAKDKRGGAGTLKYLGDASQTLDQVMSPAVLAPAGGSQPHENRQPFLTTQYCIATVGVFPSRS
ncbi:phage tail protein [Gilvimarinus agarilyticus]|uniref:phage tail protein n=1 Tax=Gilvimarinus agarilyticus TaxID=679259 RepID=UPI0005A27073|nr:tail fiber protein [Gilvimarinus agarilyticus]